jgi:hypothetical protein
MAASHPEILQKSTADKSEILKLVQNHFLLDREVLRWRPANGEDIPTPTSKFGLPTCELLHNLLHHYQIELVYLNPNSIL